MLDEPAVALLADALRANRTLTCLRLKDMRLLRHAGVATTVLGAPVGHASLRTLRLSSEPDIRDAARVGDALGALVAADSPALQDLHLSRCSLGDAGFGPLVDALPRNTHLATLLMNGSGISAEFARERLCRRCAPTARCAGWSPDTCTSHWARSWRR